VAYSQSELRTEREITPLPTSRIINGELSSVGQFPFATALRTRQLVSLSADQVDGRGKYLEGSVPQSFSAETALCRFYADDECAESARGKICIMYFDYFEVGLSTDTPSEQLDRCASVGGIAAIFLETSNGTLDIDHVRDAQSDIPAIDGGLLNEELGLSLFENVGSSLRIDVLIPKTVFCGGSYLGNRWVLTAAHCVTSPEDKSMVALPESLTATVGVNNLDSDQSYAEYVRVEQVVVNPNYAISSSGALHGDWALLRLAREPSSGAAIRVATQDVAATAKQQSNDVTLIGWGTQQAYFLNSPNSAGSSELYSGVASLVSTQVCNSGFSSFNNAYAGGAANTLATVFEEEICHGSIPNFNVDTCQGDSGGPVVLSVNGEQQLVGVTSWGIGCGSGVQGLYSVSTSPSYHVNKISEISGFDVSASDNQSIVSPATGLPSSTLISGSGGGGSLAIRELVALILIMLCMIGVRRKGKS